MVWNSPLLLNASGVDSAVEIVAIDRFVDWGVLQIIGTKVAIAWRIRKERYLNFPQFSICWAGGKWVTTQGRNNCESRYFPHIPMVCRDKKQKNCRTYGVQGRLVSKIANACPQKIVGLGWNMRQKETKSFLAMNKAMAILDETGLDCGAK